MLGLLIQEVCFTTFTTLVLKRYFPLLIFMGVGAMTDFGALIAKPKAI
ncbi:sodium ion-translocating decarboxylase subunit beta [Vibrio lentus]|nr:sodium ion-translocating decarboxylase subunit beta [Vibrio lentus]